MHDVAVIGMGLCGSIAATCLARSGYDVVVIDRYPEHPPEFAAEQIVGSQVDALRKLGVLEAIVGDTPEIRRVEAARDGRIFETLDEAHYGLSYQAMVSGARSAIPNTVTKIYGSATAMLTTPTLQLIHTAVGETISARLIIMAAGVKPLADFGFERRMIRKNHSLSIGFDVEGSDYRNVLAYFPENFADRIDYLTLFPMDGKLRANLFLYREPSDEWVRDFRLSPNYFLSLRLPGLKRVIGDFTVGEKITIRPVSLYQATGLEKPGVVVIGNAYQAACPAVGCGIGRIATEVDLLCNLYIPIWLGESPKMLDWETFSRFYQDPIKVAVDQEAMRGAEYRRKLATETGMRWKLHRSRVKVQQAVRRWTGRKAPASTPPSMMAGVS